MKIESIQKVLNSFNFPLAIGLILSFAVLSCTKGDHRNERIDLLAPVPDSVYAKAGNRIIAVTFDTLRNSLLEAIRSQGIEEAIAFCSENAYSITGVYADSVTVRRTALRFRNPANKPDSLELLVLKEMSGQPKTIEGTGTKIVRHESSGEIHYFKSIVLQPMCLNCHGTPGEQIKEATLARIQQLYPDDKAVNFKEGDLRGVWHIVFKSQRE